MPRTWARSWCSCRATIRAPWSTPPPSPITTKGEDNPAALEFVEFLLSEEGQTYFVEETWEYPLVEGIADPEGLPALEELAGPQLDLTDLDSLEATITLLTDKGLLG